MRIDVGLAFRSDSALRLAVSSAGSNDPEAAVENIMSLNAFPFGDGCTSAARLLPSDPGQQIAFALVDLNMHSARQRIREHKTKTGQSLSFAGLVVSNLAQGLAVCT